MEELLNNNKEGNYQALVQKFKEHVVDLAQNESFRHSDWYTEYHLEIVEKIGLELCDKFYPEANKDEVILLTWLHDYGKMVDFDNQHERTQAVGKEALLQNGFDEEYVGRVIDYIQIFDSKEELEEAPIELKIVSSADAAAHLVGPFYSLWYWENPDHDYRELMKSSRDKALLEWDKKVVLPEVKEAFEERYRYVLEQNGSIPEEFFLS